MMNWLKNFFKGRYGGDQLSLALLCLSIVFMFLDQAFRLPLLTILSYVLIGIVLYRMFSRDITRRSLENYKFRMLFSQFSSKFYQWSEKIKKEAEARKTHKIFNCPTCDTKLRVPRGKGKILITCPRCKTQFTRKT